MESAESARRRGAKRNAASVEATIRGTSSECLNVWSLVPTVGEVVSANSPERLFVVYLTLLTLRRTPDVYGPWLDRRGASQLPLEVQRMQDLRDLQRQGRRCTFESSFFPQKSVIQQLLLRRHVFSFVTTAIEVCSIYKRIYCSSLYHIFLFRL